MKESVQSAVVEFNQMEVSWLFDLDGPQWRTYTGAEN